MQFECKVGTDYSTVIFGDTPLKVRVIMILFSHYERIGGICEENGGVWKFPLFVTPEVIQEIIRNTCFECGGLMKNSTAFKNEDVIEEPNGFSMTSHIFTGAGEAKQIIVRKCTVCGHSHT